VSSRFGYQAVNAGRKRAGSGSAGIGRAVVGRRAVSSYSESNLTPRMVVSRRDSALIEPGCAVRRARRAIRPAEIRKAARIGCRIMTLGRGTRINFPQNVQSLIASGKSTLRMQA
jgi:hypothetical protein